MGVQLRCHKRSFLGHRVSSDISNEMRRPCSRVVNLFAGDDLDVFQALLREEFNISGFHHRDLAQRLQKAGRLVSLLLKRLRCHGLIKKIGHCYKYYLTALGRSGIAVRCVPSLGQFIWQFGTETLLD